MLWGAQWGGAHRRKPIECKKLTSSSTHFRAKPTPCGGLSHKHFSVKLTESSLMEGGGCSQYFRGPGFFFSFLLILYPLLLPMKVLVPPAFLFHSFISSSFPPPWLWVHPNNHLLDTRSHWEEEMQREGGASWLAS